METDIQFVSTIGICTEFESDGEKQGEKQEVSIVISPLKISQVDNSIKVVSGCSMWKSCQNSGCQFSLVSRGVGRIQVQVQA